jgi:3alpha(or 20beta)-hydroxysteroid dehydrogenase
VDTGATSDRLDGRAVAALTGGPRQGAEIARHLATAGCRVIAGDVLPEVQSLARDFPDSIEACELDVREAASWAEALARGVGRFGHLDALVNNAGVLRRLPIERETPADFEAVWRVNGLGAVLGVQAALPHLRAAGGGSVVNTPPSRRPRPGATAAYVSSKWAAAGFSRVAALELAADRIRVNSILPGPVLTPMVLRDDDPGAAERMSRTPLGRAGQPADIAHLVHFLISDRSSFVTGAEIVIDGGQTAGVAFRGSS